MQRKGRKLTNSVLDLEGRFLPSVRHRPLAFVTTRSPSRAPATVSPYPPPAAPPRRHLAPARSRDCRRR